jgi:hypothetical protein
MNDQTLKALIRLISTAPEVKDGQVCRGGFIRIVGLQPPPAHNQPSQGGWSGSLVARISVPAQLDLGIKKPESDSK